MKLEPMLWFLGILALSVPASTKGEGDPARFVGAWVATTEQEAPSPKFPARVDLICGPRCSIAVEGGRLVVTRPDAAPEDLTFWLDGRTSINAFEVAGVAVRFESTARVESEALVIAGRAVRGDLKNVQTLTLTVEADQLVVERLGQGRASRNPVRVVYRRSGEPPPV